MCSIECTYSVDFECIIIDELTVVFPTPFFFYVRHVLQLNWIYRNTSSQIHSPYRGDKVDYSVGLSYPLAS
jgi:hypothetical protein